MKFTSNLKIGEGIYTIHDISKILRIPYFKVNRWINKYWDTEFAKILNRRYSYSIADSKAVNFHTLIELYILYLLTEAGVKTKKVIDAYTELSKDFNIFFPFAQKQILEKIRTDGHTIYLESKDSILSLDGTKQFNLGFIKIFFKNLEFDRDLIASRFWPLGKEKSIIVDPKRQFGRPIIGNTNIYPETIHNLYKGGEPINFIAFIYEIDEKLVNDAIEYCQAA